MKKITLLSILLLSVLMGYSQKDDDDEKTSLSVALVSDTFFGFAPLVTGDYELNETTSFTYYGIFWSGGTGAAWGNWAEFGAGVNFQVSDAFNVNPQLGILSGNLLSSFAEGPSVIGDGFVPNLIVGLDTDELEGELYFGYYLPLRSEGETTSNFIHYWANAGYKLSNFVSSGLHFEQLYGGADSAEASVYQWFGPYVQFSDLKGRGFLRFSGGVDFEDGGNSFYKMAFGFNF